MKQTITILLLAGLAAGCAGTSGSSAPTHRWESTNAATEVQYRNDHARCQSKAKAGSNGGTFDAESDAFAVYKQCMVNQGYELTAYAAQE
jgi:hypothetical protein